MKVKKLRFERVFPTGHSRQDRCTYFAEAIIKAMDIKTVIPKELIQLHNYAAYNYILPKSHTIRKGNNWNEGDMARIQLLAMSPWHPMAIRVMDVVITKIWNIEVKKGIFFIENKPINLLKVQEIAKNDGFTLEQFLEWYKYPKPLKGQILCWNSKIEYNG